MTLLHLIGRTTVAPRVLVYLVALVALVETAGCRTATDLPYSQFKNHIAAGDVAEVRFDGDRLDAISTVAARRAGAPELWTTVAIGADAGLIPLLDAIGKSRTGGSGGGANDEREHTLNQLLVEMDGFASRNGLIVIAATNRADTLDAALLRPGRFDRQVLVDKPDSSGREAILRVHARKLVMSADADLGTIARRTAGMAGADLENVLNEAALLAARGDKQAIGMFELDAAIDRVVAGLERKGRLTNEKERRIVAYHEGGHAVIAELAPTADPVRRVSIVPRGLSALGYVQQTAEDRHLLQEDELMDRLAVLLGGRAAEHVVFGKLSTGASNDLERATDLARRMVCEFGMSGSVGPVSFGPRGNGDRPAQMSEAVTGRIETEVQSLLARAFDRACGELTASRAALDAVAAAFLERGGLDRDERLQIMSGRAGSSSFQL